MTSVTWNGAPAYVIDVPWNTGDFQVGAMIPSDVDTGETQRETRTAFGDTVRISAQFTSIAGGLKATAIRNAFQNLGNSPVICPLWPALRFPADSHPVTAGYWTVFQYGVFTGFYSTAGLPGSLPAGSIIIPALIGRLKSRPEATMLTDEIFSIAWDFVENTSEVVTLASVSTVNGPTVGGITPKIFPLRSEWSHTPAFGMPDVNIDIRQIGPSRSVADAYYDQQSRRREQQGFLLTGNDAWSLLRFFQDRGGLSQSFWLEGSLSDVRMSSNVASGTTSIPVDSVTARDANQYFYLRDAVNREIIKVTGNGVGAWTISPALVQSFSSSSTQIRSALLSRFSQNRIEITFESAALAHAQIQFVELPSELSTPVNETMGVTIGSLPQRSFTYTFTIPYPAGAQIYRQTSMERQITLSGNTYSPVKLSHGEIKSALNLERQPIEITLRDTSSHPLFLLIPHRLEWPLILEICEVDVSGGTASNARCIFYGVVSSAEIEGPFVRATASTLGAALEKRIPSKVFQPNCNFRIYSNGCGVLPSAFEYLATISFLGTSPVIQISVNAMTLGGGGISSLPAHWFAGGYVITSTLAGPITRRIADSTVMVSGAITITLATAADGAVLGNSAKLYPGCDRRYSTCSSKFSNQVRYGGFPRLPIGNPSMIKASEDVIAGGKK